MMKEIKIVQQSQSFGQKRMNFGFHISMCKTPSNWYAILCKHKTEFIGLTVAVWLPTWTRQAIYRRQKRLEIWHFWWDVPLKCRVLCPNQMWHEIWFVSIWYTKMPICYCPKKEFNLSGRKSNTLRIRQKNNLLLFFVEICQLLWAW